MADVTIKFQWSPEVDMLYLGDLNDKEKLLWDLANGYVTLDQSMVTIQE